MSPDLEALLAAEDVGSVAILVDDQPSPLAGLSAPGLTTRVFDAGLDTSTLHTQLAAYGRYDVIIVDAANSAKRPALFRNVFLHLRPGGTIYFRTLRERDWPADQRSADRHLWPYLAKLHSARAITELVGLEWRRRDQVDLSAAIGRLVSDEDELSITNRLDCYAKLREHEVNAVLQLRPDLGTVLVSRPARPLVSRAILEQNFVPFETHHEVFDVPPLYLRRYRDVLCRPGGAVARDRLLLPESFRHGRASRLRHQQAPSRSHLFSDVLPTPPVRRLAGSYLYLDSEYPDHFGHFVSEVVSRLWGWEAARELRPDVKALLSLPPDGDRLPGFIREILAAAGIGPEDIVTFAAEEMVEVEELLGVTPMYAMPDWVHPDIVQIWARIGNNLLAAGDDEPAPAPQRLFLLRPPGSHRQCHNEDDLVARFVAAGFEPVRPETFPLAAQVAMFRSAEVIAGFGGSALLNLIYCDTPTHVILVGPESYTSNNEYLIGSVLGHRIEQIASLPDIPHPPGNWSRTAFYSEWSFDFGREGHDLDRVLAALDGLEPPSAPEPEPEVENPPTPLHQRLRRRLRRL